MFARTIALTIATVAAVATLASASPTPVPGGANQVKAVTGTIGQTVFNGVLRVKILELRDATPADHPETVGASASQKVMVINVLLRNGSHDSFTGLLGYTMADKDDVSFEIPDNIFTHANLNILQAAAQKQSAIFAVDKDFVPVKLVVTCKTCPDKSPFKSIRFTVPAAK